MFTELIIYNYCEDELGQDSAVCYIKELIQLLNNKGINTSFQKIVDGNSIYSSTYLLIKDILNYWRNSLCITNIYNSFLFIINNEEGTAHDIYYFPDTKDNNIICRDLLNLTDGKKITPAFFNAIIITGIKFKLEEPFGVELGDIKEGGVSVVSQRLVTKMA